MADARPLLHATGSLVRARNDGTHPRSPGPFSRPPTMVIASRSLPRYNRPLIRCFVTLAPNAPEMGVLCSWQTIIFTYLKTSVSNRLKRLFLYKIKMFMRFNKNLCSIKPIKSTCCFLLFLFLLQKNLKNSIIL